MTRSLATSAAPSKTERLAHVGESTGVSRLIRQLGAWNGVMAFAYHRVGAMDPDIRRRCLGPGVSTERFALMLTVPQVFAWR